VTATKARTSFATATASTTASSMLLAVDFDGTVVEHRYPDIGLPVPGAIESLREAQNLGARIMLWTMRDGSELAAAVAYMIDNGIKLFGVNKNPETDWTTSPKLYAHCYIDDAALGCPLRASIGTDRPSADWNEIRPMLLARLNPLYCP